MNDSYLKFVNKPFGSKLSSMLGLPQPRVLERHNSKKQGIDGKVLIGAACSHSILNMILRPLDNMDADIRCHPSFPAPIDRQPWTDSESIKAVIFDATGLNNSAQSETIYDFFNSTVKSIKGNGRVVILGRPASNCASPEAEIAQRALEGLSRSLAKELGKAIAVQLVLVESGAENNLESTLRFLLSARSSYVSGQVVRVSANSAGSMTSIDWSTPLAGKKILVTGASQGIGAAIAEVLARDGAELTCLDIPQTSDALNAICRRLDANSIELNLNEPNADQKLIEFATQKQAWDVVVHNAGITRDKTIARMSAEQWNSVININLSVQQKINRALLASNSINNGGRIICVSSISGIAGNRGQSNYAYSKAGVIGMVQSMAPIVAERDITINAVAPGFIETKMTAAIPFAVREAGRRLNSMSQGGLPVDVAETISWFASPASSSLNGNVVRVCGQSLLGA